MDESDRVTFDAISRTSRSRAAVQRAEKAQKGDPPPGQYFIAEPRVMDGGEMPTKQEWIEGEQKKRSGRKPVTKFGGGGPDRRRVQTGKGK